MDILPMSIEQLCTSLQVGKQVLSQWFPNILPQGLNEPIFSTELKLKEHQTPPTDYDSWGAPTPVLSTLHTTSQPNCEPQNSTVLYNYEVNEASSSWCCIYCHLWIYFIAWNKIYLFKLYILLIIILCCFILVLKLVNCFFII